MSHKRTPEAALIPKPPDPLQRAPLAYKDAAFLDSADGRLVRILAEYQEPLVRFRRQRIADTIVFFGSARFRALDVASANLQLLENTGSATPAPPHEQPATPAEIAHAQATGETPTDLKLSLANAAVEMASYYEDARTLARMLATWAKSLPGPRHRFVVTSGGGPGIMEAANRGAWEAGAKTIGLNIRLPFEQLPNPYITPELNFEFNYFFTRKYWFAYLAKALVVFPGGFGTLDEMFELLTLTQTNKLASRMTIVIYGSSYWKSVLNLDLLAAKGAIAPKDLTLFQFADTPQEAFDILQAGLTHHIPTPDLRLMHEHGHPLAHEADPQHATPPAHPAPDVQSLLGPDINKTRP